MFDPALYVGMFNIVTKSYVVTVSGTQIVKADNNRVALYLSAQAGLSAYVGLSPQVTQATAQFQFTGGTTFKLIWSQDGIMCQQALYMFISSAGPTITVTELIFFPNQD